MVSCDTIIDWMKEQVESKNPVSPHLFLDAVTKLSVLVGDETDKLFDLQHIVAELKHRLIIDTKCSVAEAKVRIEANTAYTQMLKQKAKCERIFEMIRIGKIRSRMAIDEYKSQ